jgi:hypothetical protein
MRLIEDKELEKLYDKCKGFFFHIKNLCVIIEELLHVKFLFDLT